ncbi:evC complex member EVC isoform X2 [Hippocampus zosterae]|uniref:evC complex member EVC isoform X2 n=1 Tax=Hippocampus zosterae TaxID=109293 RepID=UPI00223CB898|nr:evC complex member EVC isoform X2 [Hippocampus zosterae]
MSDQDLVVKCSANVLVNYVESLHVYTGLLTVATVCGGLSGILAAALLYVFCLKTLIFTRQGNNARRLLESHDGELENNTSDHARNDRKEAPPATASDKEKKQEPTNNDVAAFASRAKVVYPINQKYRPLADGASNPSLHECSKLPTMPKDDSSSSFTEGESLSQELDNDDGSQFISSSSVPKNLQNQSFVRVSHYSYTLTQTGFEAKINLHCLALKDVQQFCSQLLEEKYFIFLQMVKKIFCSHFPRDKKDAEFTKRLLQMQQKEVEELTKQLPTGHAVSDDGVDAPCTLEEMERSQKDFLEGSLQMSKRFSKMVEELCQHVMKRTSSFTVDEAHDCTLSLNQTLVLVENHLMKAQEAQIMQIHQKLLWWEELTGLLQSQPALVQQEASLRQALMATALEQLNSENVLTFSCMETILSQVQHAHAEGLRQCREDYMRRTKELLVEKCNKMEAKRKKLWTSQDKERSRLLELRQTHGDPEQLSKEYQELSLKQRQKLYDLELQQDDRMAESLCNVWTKLRSTWSKRLEEGAKDIFCMSVTTQCKLSHERCQTLWLDVEQQFAAQQQQAERTIALQMDQIHTQIEQDRQVWTESRALMHASLKDLKNQQTEILRAMVVSQSYTLNSHVGKLLDKKHEHLLASVQRQFMARHFCLHLLKEMRLSKLKVLSRRDFRALLMQDPATVPPCVDSAVKESSASLAEKHLGPESQLVSHSFHQEFLSELETGTEILINHSQLVLGNALSFAVLRLMEGRLSESQSCSRRDDASKRHLTEAASESVYVTKDSLTALVQTYYSHLQDIAQKLRPHQSNTNLDVTLEDSSGNQLNKALLRELDNWGRKPASAKLQQRVEFHKRKILEQCNLEQEMKCEDLRRRKVAQDQDFERINVRLQEAERKFMSDLAALARVSLHSPDAEDGDEDDDAGKPVFSGEEMTSIMDLLARNPALDPALNPLLTPTVVTPATSKPTKKKRRRQEAQNS